MLMQWGQVVFDIMPLNIHEWEEEAETDFAKKEILGATPPYELTGDDGERLTLRGRYYPKRVGGMNEYKVLKAVKAKGLAQQMVRGDGEVLGWYQCHRLHQQGTFLAADGVAKVVTFEALFFRAGIPSGDAYFSSLYAITSGSNG
jgi:phage protein U